MCEFGLFCLYCSLLHSACLAGLATFLYVDGLFCSSRVHVTCFCMLCMLYWFARLLLWFIFCMLMVSSLHCACIRCGLCIQGLFCFASLLNLVYFAYVDGFSCSIEMHLVCLVYCVCGFVLPVLCLWFLLYILMVSSVQCVYICCEFACCVS